MQVNRLEIAKFLVSIKFPKTGSMGTYFNAVSKPKCVRIKIGKLPIILEQFVQHSQSMGVEKVDQ